MMYRATQHLLFQPGLVFESYMPLAKTLERVGIENAWQESDGIGFKLSHTCFLVTWSFDQVTYVHVFVLQADTGRTNRFTHEYSEIALGKLERYLARIKDSQYV